MFVWSSARAGAAATARARKLDRARGDLDQLTRGLGSRHYPTVDKVQAATGFTNKRLRALVAGLLGTFYRAIIRHVDAHVDAHVDRARLSQAA